MTLMGYATDELDPKDYVDAHLFYDLVFAAFISVALMEIIKSHKWRTGAHRHNPWGQARLLRIP